MSVGHPTFPTPAPKRINDPEKAQAIPDVGNKLRKDPIESSGADLDHRDVQRIEESLRRRNASRDSSAETDPRIGYAESYKYTPRELKEQIFSMQEAAGKRERQRTAKMAQLAESYDSNTEVKIRDMKEDGASEDDITKYEQARRDHKDERVAKETEEILAMWDRQERAFDVQQRIQDMEREKPKDAQTALKAIDGLWNRIDQALREQAYNNRNYRIPEESLVDKEWADYVLKILNNLRDQMKFEGSVSVRILDDLRKARNGTWSSESGRGQRHIESKWLEGIGNVFSGFVGERYIETPDQERERRIARDNAIEKYMNAM